MAGAPPERPRDEAVALIAKIIQDLHIAMLVTRSAASGNLHARPMAVQADGFDGTLYFFTEKTTQKMDDIASDPIVNVSFASSAENSYVSLCGTATIDDDRAKIEALWNPFVQAWYPDGPSDPNVTLLRVDVDGAEFWDGSSSKLVMGARLVKALLTGTEAGDAGRTGTVSF